MSVVLMSKRELNRIDILARLDSGRLTPGAAATLLQVSERQVYRLRRRFQDGGPAAIADRRRGRPSNNRLPALLRDQAVALVREPYADFGPTLAAEKLKDRHDLRVSRETLRSWLIQGGAWPPGAREALGRGSDPAGGVRAGNRAHRLSPTAPSPRAPGRADPDRWLRAPLVRRSRPALHASGVRGRCHQPPDGAGLCAVREHLRVF